MNLEKSLIDFNVYHLKFFKDFQGILIFFKVFLNFIKNFQGFSRFFKDFLGISTAQPLTWSHHSLINLALKFKDFKGLPLKYPLIT